MKKQKLIIESIQYITGLRESIKLQGKHKELKAFRKVLNASRNLYESLQKKNVTLQEIERLVDIKKRASIRFQQITGQSWPL